MQQYKPQATGQHKSFRNFWILRRAMRRIISDIEAAQATGDVGLAVELQCKLGLISRRMQSVS